jgi:hypothetical protein
MPFSQILCRAGSEEEQLFFHPANENLSPGTPDLTEKLRQALSR